MRLRNITGSKDVLAASHYVCDEPLEHKGKWRKYFQNENPIHIEIGMGMGQFIASMAECHPEVNYIGIEKFSGVLSRAVKRLEQGQAQENLSLLCLDACELGGVFAEGEISHIYLNFSDPWPKTRHARRRLTASEFLKIYEKILVKGGELELKTDNEGFFRFSMTQLEAIGWELRGISYDLHSDRGAEQPAAAENIARSGINILTEYEEKFSGQGKTIFWCAYRR
jgi:tRNA (guanine-N7-)-methyltransferase